jgi:TRAP-type transport system small permease protein
MVQEGLPVSDEATGAGPGLGAGTQGELLPTREPFRTIFRYIGLAEQAIAVACMVVLFTLVLLQVLQRYLPSGGWAWTGEVAQLALVWLAFILSGYLMAIDRHITIQLVDYVLPPRALGAVKLLVHLVVGATCLAMAYSIYDLIASDIGQRTPAAEIPLVWIYVVPMVGFVLTLLRAALWIVVADIPQVRGRGPAGAAA